MPSKVMGMKRQREALPFSFFDLTIFEYNMRESVNGLKIFGFLGNHQTSTAGGSINENHQRNCVAIS
jgi:hypothetical protein